MDFPDLKLKVMPTFPSQIIGGTGLSATKANGKVTLDYAWQEFGAISSIPTSPTSYILTYDTVTNAYVMVPSHLLGGAASGIADAPLDAVTYGRMSGAWVAALALAGGTMTGPLILNASPTVPNGAATKAYVDAAATAAGVTSFKSRAGAVVPALHDYTSALLDTTAGFTGTVLRSQLAKNNDTVCAIDFGADPSGNSDSTAAMQAAHNTGRVVYYPSGSYKFSTISFASGGIRGDGMTSILFTTDTGANNAITYTGTGGGPQVPIFRDFLMQPFTSKSGGAALAFFPSSGELGYVDIYSIVTYAMPYGVFFGAVAHFTVSNSKFINYTAAGIVVQNSYHADSGDSFIGGCTFNTSFAGGSAGVVQASSGGLKLFGNKFLGGSYGYRLSFTGAMTTGDLMIVGNSFEQAALAAIVLERASGSNGFGAVTISGNQMAINPIGVYVDGSGFLSQLAITGNVIAVGPGGTYGISIGSCNLFTIVGNTLIGRNSGDVGIATGGPCSNAKIGGNLISGFAAATSLGGTNISTAF